jgi:hypothetical protein
LIVALTEGMSVPVAVSVALTVALTDTLSLTLALSVGVTVALTDGTSEPMALSDTEINVVSYKLLVKGINSVQLTSQT